MSPVFIKAIVIALLLLIVYCLGSAMLCMVRPRAEQPADGMVKALSWRIGLSLLTFFVLLGGYALGWIHPHF